MGEGRGTRGDKGTDFALPGEAVYLLEAGPGDAALEDAKVLLRVYVEGLLVDAGVVEGGLGGVEDIVLG